MLGSPCLCQADIAGLPGLIPGLIPGLAACGEEGQAHFLVARQPHCYTTLLNYTKPPAADFLRPYPAQGYLSYLKNTWLTLPTPALQHVLCHGYCARSALQGHLRKVILAWSNLTTWRSVPICAKLYVRWSMQSVCENISPSAFTSCLLVHTSPAGSVSG